MYDATRALADMAQQIRSYRAEEGLTLQKLAARSGVAASTIHKIEARQMIPTVSVLFKIARGLNRRPEDLIRDTMSNGASDSSMRSEARSNPNVGVWRIDLAAEQALPPLDLDPSQRAILLVEMGAIDLQAGAQRILMDAGDCIEVEGERIESPAAQSDPTRLTLIVSPPGNLERCLGSPSQSTPVFQ
jgi:transcriptional regulator with XRE-family HTH domain